MPDEIAAPSPLFEAQRGALARAAALGPIVDVACGRGRHALASARAGWETVAIDRNAEHLAQLEQSAAREGLPLQCVEFDLETDAPFPAAARSCGAILVFRFLYRPLAPALAEALVPGGVLLYETFTRHQPELGWGPKRPAFLLEAGELPRLFPSLEVVETSEGLHRDAGRPEHIARFVGRRT